MTGRGAGVSVSAVLLAILVGAAPTWAQASAETPPDTTPALTRVLGSLDSGERVRLHLPDREPMDAPFARASSDSLFLGEDSFAASVALSRIRRVDVASHPYRLAAGIGGAAGAVLGGVVGALAAEDGEPDRAHFESSPNQLAPLASATVGLLGGGLAGAGIGALVAAGITDWEQLYPTPE